MLTLLLALAATELTPIAPPEPTTSFDANGRTFTGTPKEVCTIQGTWDDGDIFTYATWDRCEEMTMDYVPPQDADRLEQQIFGIDEDFIVPAGHEGYVFDNKWSGVMIFRDRQGRLKEILVSDY